MWPVNNDFYILKLKHYGHGKRSRRYLEHAIEKRNIDRPAGKCRKVERNQFVMHWHPLLKEVHFKKMRH